MFGEMKQERVSAYSGKAYEVGRKQEIEARKGVSVCESWKAGEGVWKLKLKI